MLCFESASSQTMQQCTLKARVQVVRCRNLHNASSHLSDYSIIDPEPDLRIPFDVVICKPLHLERFHMASGIRHVGRSAHRMDLLH